MMTDAMKPLGLSFFQLTAARPMYTAGGRLFVDVIQDLVSPQKRDVLVNILGKSDPLIQDALLTIIDRRDFIPLIPDDKKVANPGGSIKAKPHADFTTLEDYEPSVVSELIEHSQASIAELKQNIRTKSGTGLFDFILEDIQQLKASLSDPRSFGAIMTAMNASSWINDKMQEWLDEKNVSDILTRSISNNITSEMGIALLDAADAIRPFPDVIEYLSRVKDDHFLNELAELDGGQQAKDVIQRFLDKYGMRCAGEIDITKPRWAEKPATLVPLILSNIKNNEPGAGKRIFEQGRQESLNKEQELLDRLLRLPDGEKKVRETKRMIGLIRNLAGFREYPKYAIINRYFIYKQALLNEAERLKQAGLIHDRYDIFYLRFDEFRESVRTNKLDYRIIEKRRDEYKTFRKITPPRVITSDGEIITGSYKRKNIPAGVFAGLPVSSGIVEGRARVIVNMDDADLEKGDILVTAFTDPSWTPLFLSVRGLVTEVGGLMTHGAVIAREYGLPAVVGVDNATRLIKDGQRIRVNGTEGFIEVIL